MIAKEKLIMMAYKICPHCNNLYDEREVSCQCQKDLRNEYSKKYYEDNKEMKKMFNSSRWKKLREIIIRRDGYMCNRCFVQLGIVVNDDLQVHHIIPRIDRPDLMFDENNLVAVCKTCNLQLGTKGELDWEYRKMTSFDTDVNL